MSTEMQKFNIGSKSDAIELTMRQFWEAPSGKLGKVVIGVGTVLTALGIAHFALPILIGVATGALTLAITAAQLGAVCVGIFAVGAVLMSKSFQDMVRLKFRSLMITIMNDEIARNPLNVILMIMNDLRSGRDRLSTMVGKMTGSQRALEQQVHELLEACAQFTEQTKAAHAKGDLNLAKSLARKAKVKKDSAERMQASLRDQKLRAERANRLFEVTGQQLDELENTYQTWSIEYEAAKTAGEAAKDFKEFFDGKPEAGQWFMTAVTELKRQIADGLGQFDFQADLHENDVKLNDLDSDVALNEILGNTTPAMTAGPQMRQLPEGNHVPLLEAEVVSPAEVRSTYADAIRRRH